MKIIDLGLIDYAQALQLQHEAVERRAESFFICEHPAVITVGRGKDSRADVLTQKLPIIDIERGGRATLHVPGQLVIYPVLNLKNRNLDQVKFLRFLEQALIKTLSEFEIPAHVIQNQTGVWVSGDKKIASLGIAVRNDMSLHGLALNVSCDLNLFENLKPCGFDSRVMTSMEKEKGSTISMQAVRTKLVENLEGAFNAPGV